MKASFSR